MREQLLHCGISQISGGSRTSVGGYTTVERHDETSQFDVSDTRTLDEVVRWLLQNDHIPSFCTACYREGRTGDRFMSLCKSGKISLCCTPNALMTLKEYLMDYASPETREVGEALIARSITDIPEGRTREITQERLKLIEGGARDFRF
jgi:2-iminoacetate synthase